MRGKPSRRKAREVRGSPKVTVTVPALSVRAAEIDLPAGRFDRILGSDRWRLIGKLSAPVAHEIINPVSAALNLASLMQHILKGEGVPPERIAEFREHLSHVIRETARAGRLASEFVMFAHAKGQEPRPADPNEVVRRAVSLASHMFKVGDIETHLHLSDLLPRIRCDSVRMQQALLNLFMNAAEALEQSERREVVVETRLPGQGEGVVLEIRDTGEGIAPELLPVIFDPFFSTRNRYDNLGLGLTVAREIVLAHRGRIEVQSRPGNGTTVTVILPVAGHAGESA
ncbi:MAG: integral rane sensor signal transduction histidine kinase [Acidobacteria bacterium]|nr:integral rane sensor signal transduction histidine kinase [Acidobacteriota bacterium]